MKSKNTSTRKMLLAVIIALTAVSGLFAQGNSQNNANGLWYAKDGDTVATNREVLIKKNLNVQGSATADSANVQVIKVGNNTLYIGNPLLQWKVGSTNYIQASDGLIFFGNTDTTNFSNIKIGIGTDSAQNTMDVAGKVVIGSGYAGTVPAPTNGLLVEGNVGIGDITGMGGLPNNKLEINSGIADASGLTFTQLDSAFTPPTTETKFLTVDGSGKVILANVSGTISTTLTAPVLISPPNFASGDFRATTFTWTSVSPCIVLYRIQVATDASFSNIVIDQSGITDTTFSAGFCDTIPATFFWRVNAKECATSPFSSVFSFTNDSVCIKIPAVPTPTTPMQPYMPSDSIFKINITPLQESLSKTIQLNGISFNWDTYNFPQFPDTTTKIGLIAQEVQPIIPEVVSTDANGYYYIDYDRLVPVLIEAIKEMKTELDALKANVTACCDSMTMKTGTTNNKQRTTNDELQKTIHYIELTSNIVVLEQNVPNPFKENTTIDYFIPENISFAQIMFYDNYGRVIKVLDIQERGDGQLQVFAQNLSSGIYSYCIVIDGKAIDTKKMMKAK